MGKDITWFVLVKNVVHLIHFIPAFGEKNACFHHPHSEQLTKHEIMQGFLLRGQV